MDIRQGKIRNINRKLIAGTLVFSLASSIIIGNNVSNYIKLERQKYENFTGVASFEKMKKCFFLEIYDNEEQTTGYYIAEKNEFFNEKGELFEYAYLNLLGRKNVFTYKVDNNVCYPQTTTKTVINEVNLEKYLYGFGMIENMYSDKDVEMLLEQMKKINFNTKVKTK